MLAVSFMNPVIIADEYTAGSIEEYPLRLFIP